VSSPNLICCSSEVSRSEREWRLFRPSSSALPRQRCRRGKEIRRPLRSRARPDRGRWRSDSSIFCRSWGRRALAASSVYVHPRSYRCLEDFQPHLVANRDEIPRLTERWPFGSNALSYELRMIFRFLPGFALMSQDVVGWKLARQIKEEPLHRADNAALKCLFPSRTDHRRQLGEPS
jgi:hypothetical protein